MCSTQKVDSFTARLLDIHSQMLEEGLKQVGVAEFLPGMRFYFQSILRSSAFLRLLYHRELNDNILLCIIALNLRCILFGGSVGNPTWASPEWLYVGHGNRITAPGGDQHHLLLLCWSGFLDQQVAQVTHSLILATSNGPLWPFEGDALWEIVNERLLALALCLAGLLLLEHVWYTQVFMCLWWRYLIERYGDALGLKVENLPENNAMDAFAEALALAWKEFGDTR